MDSLRQRLWYVWSWAGILEVMNPLNNGYTFYRRRQKLSRLLLVIGLLGRQGNSTPRRFFRGDDAKSKLHQFTSSIP